MNRRSVLASPVRLLLSRESEQMLREAFAASVTGHGKFTRRHVIHLADLMDLSCRDLVLWCEHLGLCRRGSWEWFMRNGGITRAQIEEVRADAANRAMKDDS